MRQSQLTEKQKQTIMRLADQYENYGEYELARRIHRMEFRSPVNNEKVWDIFASFYSILNAVRRHRAKGYVYNA